MTTEEELQALRKLMETELERKALVRDRNRKILFIVVASIVLLALVIPLYFTNRAREKKERQEKAEAAEEFVRQRQEHIKTRKLTEELRGMPLSQFDELMRETKEVLQRTPSPEELQKVIRAAQQLQ
jgi:hypothetical protein